MASAWTHFNLLHWIGPDVMSGTSKAFIWYPTCHDRCIFLGGVWNKPHFGDFALYYRLAVPAPGYPGISQALPEILGISRHFQVYPRAFESLRKEPTSVKVKFFQVPGPINISASVHFRAFISLLRYPCKSKITLQSKFQPNRTSGSWDIAIFFKNLTKIWP